MKGKLVGCDWELNTLTLQFDNLDDFSASAREMIVSETETWLSEGQKKDLEQLISELPPEDVMNIDFADIFGTQSTGIGITQDTLPVIRAYLDLIEEKMNS